MICIRGRNFNVYDFVDRCYHKDAYIRSNTPIINPVNGPQQWPNRRLNSMVPLEFKKKPGRPKKVRKR